MNKAIDSKYVHSDLSYEIIGAAYDVQNDVGIGHPEKTYQRLLAKEFKNRGLEYNEQVKGDLLYKGVKETFRRFDFVIDNKIVVELKVGEHIGSKEFDQIKEYLKISDLQLGLIIQFNRRGVRVHRIANLI